MNQKLKILIVDDDRRMVHTLADILTIRGHMATEAFSGEDALAKAQAQDFDCVLADFKMPGMDGLELHRRLRQVQPGLPVVLMTAFAANEIIRQGLDEGVIGVFDKPLDMNKLLSFFASLSKNRVIAIVDDDSAFCKTLGDILSKRGFGVAQITDPHTAVDQMVTSAQVVLLDMKLNSINGLDVLREIREHAPQLPVLLVTGYRQEMAPVILRALEFQATVCLYKPLEIPALLEILTQLQLKHLRGLIQ